MMNKPMSDAGVSESFGFIIIFGIYLTALALIFAIGYPLYNDYVYQSHMQNMVQGFDLVSDNGNNVALLKTPYQQSELKLYGGTIAVKDAGNLQLQCYADTGGNNPIVINDGGSVSGDSVTLRVLEYSRDDSSIAYLLGGVFKKDAYTYPVIKKPVIYNSTRLDGTPVLIIPLITLYDNVFASMGNAPVRISFGTLYYSKKDQTVDQPKLRTYKHVKLIKITISGDYKDSLYTYFQDEWGFSRVDAASNDQQLVMEKIYDTPDTGIIVNTFQSVVITSINTGSV
jgi:hypothetical protein